MMTFNQLVPNETPAQHVVYLTYHQRVKGRLRITTEEGLDAGIVSERGLELLNGNKLSDESGRTIEVRASDENVSVATTDDYLLFSRACYHIGNRHAEVQIQSGKLIYLNDPVLDDMLSLLGLEVSRTTLPFSPENGAYHKGHGGHAHGHAHHDHSHDEHTHTDHTHPHSH